MLLIPFASTKFKEIFLFFEGCLRQLMHASLNHSDSIIGSGFEILVARHLKRTAENWPLDPYTCPSDRTQ